MSERPLISVIIPTYNRAHLIGETLDSVLLQTYSNWECIVVDDGSEDETEELLSTYIAKDSRIKYFKRPDTHLPGGNGARNYGFEVSQGVFVQWFDSDDLMRRQLLEKQIYSLTENNAKICICLLDRYNEDFSEINRRAQLHNVRFSIYYDFILRSLKASLLTTCFHKKTIEMYKFDETLKKSQEVEFLQRIFRENENDIFLLNKSLVKVRRHNKSITGSINKRTVADKLRVKKCLIIELPHDTPENVKDRLEYEYFRALYSAFHNKYSFIYFQGLFFNNNYLKPLFYKLVILYIFHYFISKGGQQYKRMIEVVCSNPGKS